MAVGRSYPSHSHHQRKRGKPAQLSARPFRSISSSGHGVEEAIAIGGNRKNAEVELARLLPRFLSLRACRPLLNSGGSAGMLNGDSLLTALQQLIYKLRGRNVHKVASIGGIAYRTKPFPLARLKQKGK